MPKDTLISGLLLDEDIELSLADLCQACSRHAEWVIELVEEGVLEPTGRTRSEWRFSGVSLQRAQAACRLQHDLGINLAGIALVLDLLDEIETLRSRLGRFEP